MAGLLEKDIRLLLQRKQAIVMFLVIAVVLGFSTEGTFIVAYTAFCLIMVAVGTVSYDEFDNVKFIDYCCYLVWWNSN